MDRTGAGGERVNLFVYGTLLDEALVRELTGLRFETRDAVIEGCQVEHNPETGYFEIRENLAGSNAAGKILFDVDEASLKKLDAYEGNLYRRGTAHAKALETRTHFKTWDFGGPVDSVGVWHGDS